MRTILEKKLKVMVLGNTGKRCAVLLQKWHSFFSDSFRTFNPYMGIAKMCKSAQKEFSRISTLTFGLC